MLKWMKGWRTFAVNVLATVVPILELTEVQQVLPEGWLPWYVLGLALVNMYMRSITTSPPGKRL